jgi:competence protein ComEC
VGWRATIGPLCALASLVAGIVTGERAGAGTARPALFVAIVALAGALLVDGRPRVLLACVALALGGSAAMQRAMDGLERHGLDASPGHVREIHGTLVSDPDGPRFTVRTLVRVAELDRILLVRASGDAANRLRVLDAGDRIDVTGRLEVLEGYDTRFRWEHAVAAIQDAEVEAFQAPSSPLMTLANTARGAIMRGTRPLDPTTRALVAGFLLGDTRAIPERVADEYRAAGLSHLLAVSGANVAFVLAVCAPGLRRLSLVVRTAAALAVVTCFAAATRFEPSVLRASALATVALLAALSGRTVDPRRALALAMIALLLVDPFLVHSVAFHLSCAASAGIAWWARPLAARLPGPTLVREPLAVSIAAQVGVTPVLLATFGSVPLLAPLANLLAAPAAEALGVFGLIAAVLGGVVPPLGIVLAPVTTVLVAWISTVAHVTAAVGGTIDTRAALVLGAVAGAAVLAGRSRRNYRSRRRDASLRVGTG